MIQTVACDLMDSVLRALKGSPSCGGEVAVCVFGVNQPSLSTPFYSALVSVCVFIALSTVFHSINFPNNSLLSHSVLPFSALLVSLPQP